MSRLCGLPCWLPIFAVALLALVGTVRGAESAPSDAATDEQTWTLVWSDLGVDDDAGAPNGGAPGGTEPCARMSGQPQQTAPAIAAPLPPAVFSGLIGLVGVYVYKRRLRLR